MIRGRKPKPTALRVVTGNPGKRRVNGAEPQLKSAIPTSPNQLNATAKVEWRRVSRELHEAGLLTGVDRAALAAYCQAYGRWAEAERALAQDPEGMVITTDKGNRIQNPLLGIARRAQADMVRYAAEFGMTPSARSRVHADAPASTRPADPGRKYF